MNTLMYRFWINLAATVVATLVMLVPTYVAFGLVLSFAQMSLAGFNMLAWGEIARFAFGIAVVAVFICMYSKGSTGR